MREAGALLVVSREAGRTLALKTPTISMKFLRLLLTLGFASMLFAGAAQAGDGKKAEDKSCSDCCKDKSEAKKEEKKP